MYEFVFYRDNHSLLNSEALDSDHLAYIKPGYIMFFHSISTSQKFDLLCVEIKPPGSNNTSIDFTKLSNEMKIMMNCLVNRGVTDAVVCGLLVEISLIVLCCAINVFT
jgi:hypothetical protein